MKCQDWSLCIILIIWFRKKFSFLKLREKISNLSLVALEEYGLILKNLNQICV